MPSWLLRLIKFRYKISYEHLLWAAGLLLIAGVNLMYVSPWEWRAVAFIALLLTPFVIAQAVINALLMLKVLVPRKEGE